MRDALFLKEIGYDLYTSIGAPGAGNNISYTGLANNQRIQLLGMSFLLTTDATVSNRRVTLLVNRSTSVLYASIAQVQQTASLAVRYFVAPGNSESTAINNLRVLMRWPFPLEMWFNGVAANGGWTITSDVENLAAGDAITDIQIHCRSAIGAL